MEGGVSGPFDGGMWERVAQRLSVPWHGVDLVMHMGYGVEDSPFTQPLAEVTFTHTETTIVTTLSTRIAHCHHAVLRFTNL